MEGERIAREILLRLKAPKKTVEEVCALTLWHMYDFNGQTKENKLRRFFVQHYPLLEKLLLVKQADFSGCADDTATAPTVERWTQLLTKMKKEGAPMTLKQLKSEIKCKNIRVNRMGGYGLVQILSTRK